MRFKITFIGSGNVATNLAHALDKAGHSINQVISRNVANAKELASKFGAYCGDTPSEMYKDSDFVIVCVSDESYYEILEDVPGGMNAIVCHTSGPVSMDILAKYSSNYGVLYPLQSLRKEEVKDLLEVPLFIEWSNDSVKSKLHDLADSISNRVREVNSTQRKEYHLAAVFANNFTNAMYTIASDYLVKQGLEFDNLLPIIQETALRLKKGEPAVWQTGPAMRGDNAVIDKHLEMLDNEELQSLYSKLSEYIKNRHHS